MRSAARRFDALHDESWRLYVDRDHQHWGPTVYDLGRHGRDREPGFLASMGRAHRLAATSLGAPLDRGLLQRLHEAALGHADPRLAYRDHAFQVTIDAARLQPGSRLWLTSCSVSLHPHDDEGRARVRVIFEPIGGREAATVRRLEAVLARGRRELAAAARRDEDARLLAVARLHARLELLHPTEDGNTRRHLVVLNKLLVEQGLWPTILDEPNDVVALDARGWASAIARGMRRFRAAARAVAYGDDVAEALRRHDRACARAGRAPDPSMLPDAEFEPRGWRRGVFEGG
jgi:hypothetical protein